MSQACAGTPYQAWTFPVQGFTAEAVGGHRGEGFVVRGYDFWDGNSHGGHPAHDIFIDDYDRDGHSDKTQAAVPILAVTGGLVVAINRGWQPDSAVRGGNYVYVYDPRTESLFYYAHMQDIHVKLGMCVAGGEMLGTMGRTGKNAYPQRSPTHLHLSWLELKSGKPQARDLWPFLKQH